MKTESDAGDFVLLSREGYRRWCRVDEVVETKWGLRARTECGYFSPPGEVAKFRDEHPRKEEKPRVISPLCSDCF